MNNYQLPEGCALMLRVSDADGRSYGGFKWPGVGVEAVAPDWNPEPECGGGLHGWLYGQGDHDAARIKPDSLWQVIEVHEAGIVMLGGKGKVPQAIERFGGGMSDAAAWLVAHEPRAASVAVIGRTAAVGDDRAATVGALGTATAGYGGAATAGNRGAATAGDGGEIRIRYYDHKTDRYRTRVGYIGEEGLVAGVAYRLNDRNEFVPADTGSDA